MHTLWNSCIAGNKEASANPTAMLTARLPFTGARKMPYLNINRALPPFWRSSMATLIHFVQKEEESIFLGINCQNN